MLLHLLAMAGAGQDNAEVPAPEIPSYLSDLHADQIQNGLCSEGVNTLPVIVRLSWRVNDLTTGYSAKVYIDRGDEIGEQRLTTQTASLVTYDVNFLTLGLGEYGMGKFNRLQTDWKFIVELWHDASNTRVSRMEVPWRRVYGTCS